MRRTSALERGSAIEFVLMLVHFPLTSDAMTSRPGLSKVTVSSAVSSLVEDVTEPKWEMSSCLVAPNCALAVEAAQSEQAKAKTERDSFIIRSRMATGVHTPSHERIGSAAAVACTAAPATYGDPPSLFRSISPP